MAVALEVGHPQRAASRERVVLRERYKARLRIERDQPQAALGDGAPDVGDVDAPAEDRLLLVVPLQPLDVDPDIDLGQSRRFFETRLWGALAAVKHGPRLIRPGGSIVLMSGSAGARPQATWTVAAAICGGIEAVARALALELAPIRVNAVAPGVLRTDLWAAMDEATRVGFYADVAAALPVAWVGEAHDVAQSIGYLMANGYTTGTTLAVDGGATVV